MKVLVTGAAGFLGYHTCKHFLDKGAEVRGIDLTAFDYPDLAGRVRFFQGDIRDRGLLEEAARGVDAVVHGAAALPLWSRAEIYSVNVGGTRNVLEVARDLGVPRVVYISSTAVYGIPKSHPVDENYPQQGVGPYGETKIEAERICGEFRGQGLCVPVIRPKTFAGPMRLGVFQILCDWVKDRKNIPIIGSGKNRYQLLHVEDLAGAIYIAATAPAAKANDTFNVGATEFTTMKGDLQALLDYAGFGRRVIPIPAPLVIPALKALERVHLSPLYEWVYETAGEDHYVEVDKIKQALGFSPKKTTADVWIDTYKWYLEETRHKAIATGVSHRVAWKQGGLKLVKLFF